MEVKIAKAYIQQGFSDHLAGFYTYLGSIPKTYLDKPMLEGSSRAAEDLKARSPNSLYLILMEWIKLTSDVNLQKYKIDQIYVLRQQKNTDREFRYEENYVKNSINPSVVQHLFHKVRNHLKMDWTGGIEDGIKRGWLIDE